MSVVRSVLFWVLFGALAGTWVGGVISRAFLPWFNTPGAGIQSQCACEPLAISTVSHTIQIELVGMLIGAVLFAVLAIVLGAGRKRKSRAIRPRDAPARRGLRSATFSGRDSCLSAHSRFRAALRSAAGSA